MVPGVPPALLLLAVQLALPPQGLCVSIISKVQPPSFFNSFLYHDEEKLMPWIICPAGDNRNKSSPSLLNEGKLVTEITLPNGDNAATALPVHIITMLSGLRIKSGIGPLG